MKEIEAVLDPSKRLPDWPTEDSVDGASALLDTGQDEPRNGQRPRDLSESVEHDPVHHGRVLVSAGHSHLGVLKIYSPLPYVGYDVFALTLSRL